MKTYDIIIIGGGLAGTSSALNLSQKGYSVLVIEKEDSSFKRACSGGMAASVQDYINLDITDTIESEIKSVNFTWNSSDKVIADLSGESPFWIINRVKLENLLRNEAIKS